MSPNTVGDVRLSSLVVYTLSNDSASNFVEGYAARDGVFQRVQPADTRGTGDPAIAGSVQGSLAIDGNGRFLFAVDAGSNEITSFQITSRGLTFVDKVGSNGKEPVSLAIHGDLLYVLNARSSAITGFRVTPSGRMKAIPGSTQPLSGNNVGPAEIAFEPSGRMLVVTEKTTNDIDTYNVIGGVASAPTVHPSAGMEPFGFAFVPNGRTMVVSDAFNGQSGAGAASSYDVTPPDRLRVLSRLVRDHNTAPCWVVTTADGRFAFTSNTGSDTISGYAIDSQGKLALLRGDGISASTGKGPSDLALAPSDHFLFVINLKGRTLGAYAVAGAGKLTRLNAAPRLPDNALGLVALQSL